MRSTLHQTKQCVGPSIRLAKTVAKLLSLGTKFRILGPTAGLQTDGFTLIELIVVMALLATVLAIAAPSLSRFFHSRTLDSEARRFLALTRYAQSRAVSEGIPMLLWIDPDRGAYGLMAEPTYTDQDDKAIEFTLDETLQIQVEPQLTSQSSTAGLISASHFSNRLQTIKFTPDGFVSETSPEWILIQQGSEDAVLIRKSRTGLNYEIQAYNQLALHS